MDKDRISAARQKLKEFQRKKYQQQITQDPTDLRDSSQSPSLDNSQETQRAFKYIQQNLDSKDSNDSETRSSTESPQLSNSTDFVKNSSPISKNTDESCAENFYQDFTTTNGPIQVSLFNNFTPAHSRNESTSTVSSQLIRDAVDNSSQFHNTDLIRDEQSNFNASTNNFLQKEHLLQMAKTVANVLEDDKVIDQSLLNHCDLEQKNEFLTTCLEEQKKFVNQLHVQLSQSNNKISELEAIISAKNAEFENRLIREINPLKEQIQIDAQTIGILVGEKAELNAANVQNQTTIKQKTEELIEINEKIKISERKITELEKELTATKSNFDDFSKSYERLKSNYEEIIKKSTELQKKNEDFELEISELRQNLNYKNTEIVGLQQELQEKLALLQLSELRMQQVTNSSQDMQSLENQHQATKILEIQLLQMKETLENVSDEKDKVGKKYQSYIKQLDERYNKVLEELEYSKKKILESEIREQNYIQTLSNLEQQLQKEKNQLVKPIEDQSEKIDTLTKSMDNLVLEQENLQSMLNEKDNVIELLKKELQELHDIREKSLEATKLAQALQSDQLGASRAVAQNHQLKIQLDEMHDAFNNLIDAKLDLTEKLQAERTIGKKMNSQLNDMEQEIEQLKKQLVHKDESLIQFEKEKLQSAQIEDQMQHYQAQSHNATTLQQELQKAFTMIENLKKENSVLSSKLMEQEHEQLLPSTEEKLNTENFSDKSYLNIEEKPEEITKDNSNVNQVSNIKIKITKDIGNSIDFNKKLEIRFKESMEKVAELTDEKQRLEHLLEQLQSETETIGEYVTLYQRQRAILKEKAREKENTFKIILEQRNQQQEQLHKLKVLVADLLKSKNNNSIVSMAIAAEENMPLSSSSDEASNNHIEISDEILHKDDVTNVKDKTTSQILDLLTEIKDCNQCFLEPNFHPCPWCSGKLITV